LWSSQTATFLDMMGSILGSLPCSLECLALGEAVAQRIGSLSLKYSCA